MTARLTIAIPTFDRNEILRRHVDELLPQLSSNVRLLILDNASPKLVHETLQDLIAKFPAADVRIVRHGVNIGSSPNIMRCMELCDTPWLWLLGDDDRPMPDSVALALAAIEKHDDHIFLSFNGMHRAVDAELHTDGLRDFVRNIPDIANMTLISCNLLHVGRISRHVRTGYYYVYSLYPHLVCLLSALSADGGKCGFLPQQIIEWGPQSEWSRVLAGKGFGLVLDVPMAAPERRRLGRLLNQIAGRYSTFAIHLLNQIGTTIDAATARHIYSQAWYRLYRFGASPMKWLYRPAGYVILRFPKIGGAIYRHYRRWRQYPETNIPKDEMNRT